MKKVFKNALAACAVLSLTATMGLAACGGDGPTPTPTPTPGHTHDYSVWHHDDYQHWQTCAEDGVANDKANHQYTDGVCACGDTEIKNSKTFSQGSETLTVEGATKYLFTGSVGMYNVDASDFFEAENEQEELINQDKSFTVTIGTQTFTLDKDNTEFTFTVSETSRVTVYGANTSESGSQDGNEREDGDEEDPATPTSVQMFGVEVKIVPAADYEDHDLALSTTSLSSRLSTGDNSLTVDAESIYLYSTNVFGEHEFIFDIENDDEYTVRFGETERTINKSDDTFTVDLQQENAYEVSTVGGTGSYALHITPAEGNENAQFGLFVRRPTVLTLDGETNQLSVSSRLNPEIGRFDEGVFTFSFPIPYDSAAAAYVTGEYAFSGTAWYSGMEIYKGDEATGAPLATVTVDNTESEESTAFETDPFNIDDGDIVNGRVTFTFKLTNLNSYTLIFGLGAPSEDEGNELQCGSIESRGNQDYAPERITSVGDAETSDAETITYTFTAPTADWYTFRFYNGNGSAQTVSVGDEDPLSIGAYIVGTVTVQLEADAVVNVVVPNVNGIGIKVYYDEEPAETGGTVSEGDMLTVGTYYFVAEMDDRNNAQPMQCTFSGEAGTYRIVSHDDTETLIVKVNGDDKIYYDMGSWTYVDSATFEVGADGSVQLELNDDMSSGDTFSFTIEKVS